MPRLERFSRHPQLDHLRANFLVQGQPGSIGRHAADIAGGLRDYRQSRRTTSRHSYLCIRSLKHKVVFAILILLGLASLVLVTLLHEATALGVGGFNKEPGFQWRTGPEDPASVLFKEGPKALPGLWSSIGLRVIIGIAVNMDRREAESLSESLYKHSRANMLLTPSALFVSGHQTTCFSLRPTPTTLFLHAASMTVEERESSNHSLTESSSESIRVDALVGDFVGSDHDSTRRSGTAPNEGRHDPDKQWSIRWARPDGPLGNGTKAGFRIIVLEALNMQNTSCDLLHLAVRDSIADFLSHSVGVILLHSNCYELESTTTYSRRGQQRKSYPIFISDSSLGNAQQGVLLFHLAAEGANRDSHDLRRYPLFFTSLLLTPVQVQAEDVGWTFIGKTHDETKEELWANEDILRFAQKSLTVDHSLDMRGSYYLRFGYFLDQPFYWPAERSQRVSQVGLLDQQLLASEDNSMVPAERVDITFSRLLERNTLVRYEEQYSLWKHVLFGSWWHEIVLSLVIQGRHVKKGSDSQSTPSVRKKKFSFISIGAPDEVTSGLAQWGVPAGSWGYSVVDNIRDERPLRWNADMLLGWWPFRSAFHKGNHAVFTRYVRLLEEASPPSIPSNIFTLRQNNVDMSLGAVGDVDRLSNSCYVEQSGAVLGLMFWRPSVAFAVISTRLSRDCTEKGNSSLCSTNTIGSLNGMLQERIENFITVAANVDPPKPWIAFKVIEVLFQTSSNKRAGPYSIEILAANDLLTSPPLLPIPSMAFNLLGKLLTGLKVFSRTHESVADRAFSEFLTSWCDGCAVHTRTRASAGHCLIQQALWSSPLWCPVGMRLPYVSEIFSLLSFSQRTASKRILCENDSELLHYLLVERRTPLLLSGEHCATACVPDARRPEQTFCLYVLSVGVLDCSSLPAVETTIAEGFVHVCVPQ